MEVELLHIHHGDKKRKIDTTQPEGRNEVEKLLKNLCEQKCAIFLERGKQTYRVTGYDPKEDKLIVQSPRGRYAKKPQLMKLEDALATCRVEAKDAKVAAVAPVAGGSGLLCNNCTVSQALPFKDHDCYGYGCSCPCHRS